MANSNVYVSFATHNEHVVYTRKVDDFASSAARRLGRNDPGFPVTIIRDRDAGRRRVHEESSRLTGLVLALLGVMKLLNDLGKPRVAALHGFDVLGLVASGMLLGVGFFGLMGRLNFDSSRKDQSGPPRNE